MNACLEIFNNQYNYEYLRFEAISVHIGSQIMDITPFKKVLNALSNFNKKINLIGINLKYIDLGGGTGIPYSSSEKNFNLQQYSNLVLKFKKINNVEIIFEPGRSIFVTSIRVVTEKLRFPYNRDKVNIFQLPPHTPL